MGLVRGQVVGAVRLTSFEEDAFAGVEAHVAASIQGLASLALVSTPKLQTPNPKPKTVQGFGRQPKP